MHPKAPKFLKRHLFKSNVPVGECGRHRVEKLTISKQAAVAHNMWCALNYHRPSSRGRELLPGEYTRLIWKDDNYFDVCVMSDTPAELRDFDPVYKNASGNVLIGGLGLGVTTSLLARKKKVRKIVVVEKFDSVIKLVAPHMGPKITVVHDDIFTFDIEKYVDKHDMLPFDFAWIDIWNHICGDNYVEMMHLRERLGDFIDGQIEMWCEKDCLDFHYHEKHHANYHPVIE